MIAFKKSLWPSSLEWFIPDHRLFIHVLVAFVNALHIILVSFSFAHEFKVILELFSASKLLKHDHLIFAILAAPCQDLLFLFLLSHIDDIGPVLLILGFKVSKEFIETLVSFGHRLD